MVNRKKSLNDENCKPGHRVSPLSEREEGLGYPVTATPYSLQFFKTLDDRKLYEFNKKKFEEERQRIKVEANALVFRYGGKLMNRTDVMEHIVMLTYAGMSMAQILGDTSDPTNVLPTPREVKRWQELHEHFKEDLADAVRYRAEVLYQDGVDLVTNIGMIPGGPTRDMVAYAKLYRDTRAEEASFWNDRFQVKTKQQIEDVTKRQPADIEETKERVNSLLERNPRLIELLDKKHLAQISQIGEEPKEISVEPEGEASGE